MAPRRLSRAGQLARLADYTPPVSSRAPDPALGGYDPGASRRWDQPSTPLTAAERRQVMGAAGTIFFGGVIAEDQYGDEEPAEWQGDQRWRTINYMWRSEAQCTAVTNVCGLPLLQATYSINPGSDDQRDVDIAQAVADNLLHGLAGGWHKFLRQYYWNRYRYGHYVGEKCWTVEDGTVELWKIDVRLPHTLYRWFPSPDGELDRVMQRVWRVNQDGVSGTYALPVIPAQKLVLSTRNQEGNDYRGVSLLRPMWRHYKYKTGLYQVDAVAAERNGMGIPWASPPEGKTLQDSDWKQAARALASFHTGEKMYMLLPGGWTGKLLGVEGQVRNIMPSIEHHDLMMARSALAHFINVDSGGTLIAARDASSFFLQSIQAESDEGIEPLNALIREWVDYNFEDVERYPTLSVIGIEQRDLDALIRGMAALFDKGALTPNAETENALRDYLDLPELPAPATPAGGGAPTVDTDSQGKAPQRPGDPETDQVPDWGEGVGAVGDSQPLTRRLSRQPAAAQQRSGMNVGTKVAWASGGQLGARAVHLSGPQLRKQTHTVYMAGAYREDLVNVTVVPREQAPLPLPGGWDVSRRRTPKEPKTLIGYAWELGDGGKSGTHCPQCVEYSEGGPYGVDNLPAKPGDGSTYCEDACSCSLKPVYGYPGELE